MKPIEVTDATFTNEVINSEIPVMVDFWAVWCGPCRVIAPIIEELSVEYSGKMKFAKLDVDNNHQTAMAYGIRSIPTLLIFKDGKVVNQLIGALPKAVLIDKINQTLSN